MVKSLDEIPAELIDHVGWRIWRLAKAWKAQFDEEMATKGYNWFSEARSNVLPHLDRAGTAQSALQSKMGVTKQAVQQFVDELVADGIIERPNQSGGSTQQHDLLHPQRSARTC